MQGLNLGAVGAETDRRGFIPVNERMQVVDKAGKALPSVYCIGDANGAASLAASPLVLTTTYFLLIMSSTLRSLRRHGAQVHSVA